MYIAQGQGQITLADKILIVTNKFYYFNHTLQISAIRLIHFEKMTFQFFPHTNVLGYKFDLAIKTVNSQPMLVI